MQLISPLKKKKKRKKYHKPDTPDFWNFSTQRLPEVIRKFGVTPLLLSFLHFWFVKLLLNQQFYNPGFLRGRALIKCEEGWTEQLKALLTDHATGLGEESGLETSQMSCQCDHPIQLQQVSFADLHSAIPWI